MIPTQPCSLQGLRDICDTRRARRVVDLQRDRYQFPLCRWRREGTLWRRAGHLHFGQNHRRRLSLAALGAGAQIMAYFDKAFVPAENWLMQLCRLSGNPVAAAEGLKTTETLRGRGQYERLCDLM